MRIPSESRPHPARAINMRTGEAPESVAESIAPALTAKMLLNL
jgi:hypothetical protein